MQGTRGVISFKLLDEHRVVQSPNLQESGMPVLQQLSDYHIQSQAAGEALEKDQPGGIDVLINNAGDVLCTLMFSVFLDTACAACCAGVM